MPTKATTTVKDIPSFPCLAGVRRLGRVSLKAADSSKGRGDGLQDAQAGQVMGTTRSTRQSCCARPHALRHRFGSWGEPALEGVLPSPSPRDRTLACSGLAALGRPARRLPATPPPSGQLHPLLGMRFGSASRLTRPGCCSSPAGRLPRLWLPSFGREVAVSTRQSSGRNPISHRPLADKSTFVRRNTFLKVGFLSIEKGRKSFYIVI